MSETLAFLWKSYKSTGDVASRNKLVLHYHPFVKNIARKIYYTLPKTVEIAEIESYAQIGLIDAIKKFNLNKKIKFETYANFRIRGAIFDGIRKQDWLPRTLRSRMKKSCRESCDNDSMPGSEKVVFDRQDGGKDEKIESYVLLSLDRINFSGDGASFNLNGSIDRYEEGIVSPPDFVEKIENRIFIREIISRLSFKERKIIYLYYFRGKTFKEIGDMLNVTESRISQIHKKALLILKKSISSTPKPAC
ncbi:MAG: sigma-70 family RNA polymerase sigma factor [Actinobacteria bacterium]|nr:sigma-70 family RNA polymerase sigma factor [Actinomycetota bacterium]